MIPFDDLPLIDRILFSRWVPFGFAVLTYAALAYTWTIVS